MFEKNKLRIVLAILLSISFITGFSQANYEKKKPDNYEELVSWYKSLEEKHPEYIEVFKANEVFGYGKVDGGYDLYYVRITNESNGFLKPEVLFLGGPHGDETVGTVGLYWFTKWLMDRIDENDKWIRNLLDNREIYIEISHNPYGFDNKQRWDKNGWDLNREADYDWQGVNSKQWGSIKGKTLCSYIENHSIRVGVDFHGGARMILYPWASTHKEISAISPSGKIYYYAPPDFYFYHISSLRLGEFVGSYGGTLNEDTIGTIPLTVGYEAPGCIAAWAYGASSRAEEKFVKGKYERCNILWVTPEMSKTTDPPERQIGDENSGYISEVIKIALHQTDIAQPYIIWLNDEFFTGDKINLEWQVYGALVVEETYVFYSFSDISDGIKGKVHDEYNGSYRGGTYWDGKIWDEEIEIPDNATDLYAVAFAKVDGIYSNIVAKEIYGNSYLRIIWERTNESYYEELNTSDGIEKIKGNIWWQSPLLHIKIGGISEPEEGYLYIMGRKIAKIGKTFIIGKMSVKVEGNYDKVEFYLNNELKYEDNEKPYEWEICNAIGKNKIIVKMYYEDRIREDSLDAYLLILR
jgi:hypothetical protein